MKDIELRLLNATYNKYKKRELNIRVFEVPEIWSVAQSLVLFLATMAETEMSWGLDLGQTILP